MVPVVYGTQRVTGNMIWYGDFKAIPQYSNSGSGGGGKGGGGGSSTISDYDYQCAFAFAVAAGSAVDMGRIWWDKTLYTLSSLPGSATLFQGGLDQSPWSYLSSYHAGEDLNYPGLVYVGMSGVDLGDSYDTPNIAYELLGKGPAASIYALTDLGYSINLAPLTAAPSTAAEQAIAAQLGSTSVLTGNQAFDTSPAYCLYDLITNDIYGASFPAARRRSVQLCPVVRSSGHHHVGGSRSGSGCPLGASGLAGDDLGRGGVVGRYAADRALCRRHGQRHPHGWHHRHLYPQPDPGDEHR